MPVALKDTEGVRRLELAAVCERKKAALAARLEVLDLAYGDELVPGGRPYRDASRLRAERAPPIVEDRGETGVVEGLEQVIRRVHLVGLEGELRRRGEEHYPCVPAARPELPSGVHA